jgi:hypothetical protein
MGIESAGREHEVPYSPHMELVKSAIAAGVDNVHKMKTKVGDCAPLSSRSTVYMFHLRNSLMNFD